MLEETRNQLTQFTSAASALAKDLDAGLGDAIPRIGPMLDQARAWAAYLADGGLLARQIPVGTPTDRALAYLTQIAEFRRAAEQWALYFDERSGRSLSSAGDAAGEEQSCMAQVEQAEQRVNAQTFALTLNTGNMNYWQLNDAIRGLNQLLSELFAIRPTTNRLLAAGRPACSAFRVRWGPSQELTPMTRSQQWRTALRAGHRRHRMGRRHGGRGATAPR